VAITSSETRWHVTAHNEHIPAFEIHQTRSLARSLQESIEPVGQPFSIGPKCQLSRHEKRLSLKTFQQLQHRAVVLLEEARRDPDRVVGVDPNEIVVERSVVDRAETDAIADDRIASFLEIADDVGSVEQWQLLEPANRTLVSVRGKNLSAKTPRPAR
jgi:hypothetical protein